MSECINKLTSSIKCWQLYACAHLCMYIVLRVPAYLCVRADAGESALCAQPMSLWHRGLFHVPKARRGSEWSGGLEPGLAHCCPLSRASGNQSTTGRPSPSAHALGKCFRAWGVAAQSGRPERARPCARCNATVADRAVEPFRWRGSVDSHTEWCHSKESCRLRRCVLRDVDI